MKYIMLLFISATRPLLATCQEIPLGSTKDGVINYYIMSVKHNANGAIDVIERVKPADGMLPRFRQLVTDKCRKEKLDVAGFEKLGYFRQRIQYDCKAKLYRNRECTYYDINGNEILSTDPEQSESIRWQPIPRHTMREVEFNKACN